MLASFVLDPGRRSHALDELARERLSLALGTYAELVGRGRAERPFAAVPLADAARYCAADSEIVLRLHDAFRPELEDHQLVRLLETIEMPLMPVLVDMESRGVCIDLTRLGEISRAFAGELAALERAIYHAAGTDFNINSNAQLGHVLFEKHQLPILKKTKTGPSTDYEVLEQLAAMGHEVPRLLIEYRELSKLKSTYVDALPGFIHPLTGRIHTSFNQTGAATGRLSSSGPNLQNIPVRTPRGEAIRRAFVAPPGAMLLTADYSQIELRLLAHLSRDPAFVEAFEQGGDIHRQTAAIIFDVAQDQVTADMRARAKTINFATIYGQGAFALARQLGITQDDAKRFIEQYFTRFAGVRAWLDRTVAEARERGYVEALFGRRLGAHYRWHRARDLRARCPLARGGSAVMSRNGFTLIELLIVVVIIGLLATIAIPKFSNTKEKAYVASMKSDLRNLATAEEAFFYDSTKYTTNFALMNNFNPSAGVTMTVNATTSGWSAP